MQKVIGFIQSNTSSRFSLATGSVRLVVLMLCSLSAVAHEFWLEPEHYRLAPDQRLVVDLKVGQNHVGEALPYFDDAIERFEFYCDQRTEAVRSRFASLPAVSQVLPCPGLNVLLYVSRPSFVTYESAAQFTDFLAYEGLDTVLARHRERGLPPQGFKEAYRRFSKLLVWQDGDKIPATTDSARGLPLEWVIEDNPYASPGDSLRAVLLLEGKPYPGIQARLFLRHNDSVRDVILRTDAEGAIRVPVSESGEYLLNAVHMRAMSPALARATGAVWESWWASVTFAVD